MNDQEKLRELEAENRQLKAALAQRETFIRRTFGSFVTDEVRAAMEGADVLVFEANHDRKMLRQGPYPWPLKQRILGNRGHLANDEAGRALANLKSRPKKIILAHLSETNNRPSIAEETVSRAFAEIGVTPLPLAIALQDEMVTA